MVASWVTYGVVTFWLTSLLQAIYTDYKGCTSGGCGTLHQSQWWEKLVNTYRTMEGVEKIMCVDKGNDALATAAMMNGGMGNQWMNNPFAYIMFLALFGNGGFGGWGNRGGMVQDAEIQNQIASLRSQMADNHNADLMMSAIKGNNDALTTLAANLNCDFNQLQQGVCNVRSAIEKVAGEVGFSAERVINAAERGDAGIIQAIQNCCCQTQQSILRMGYENQLGQKDIVNAMQQNFAYTNTGVERAASNMGWQMSQMACDLKTNANENTQRIVDVLNQHWNSDLQQRYNDARLELSQQRQNAALIAALGTKTTTTTA